MRMRSTDDERQESKLSSFFNSSFIRVLLTLAAFWLLSCSGASPDREQKVDQERPLDALECRHLLRQAVRSEDVEGIPIYAEELLLRDRELAFSTANAMASTVLETGSSFANYALYSLASSFVDRFVEQSRAKELKERERAVVALGRIYGATGEVVAALIERLDDDKSIIRFATESLGYLRSDAKAAIPRLREMVQQERGSLRELAARSIVLISVHEARKILEESKGEDPEFAEIIEGMIFRQEMEDLS